MGEYLRNSKDEQVCKLGTCENWRYVREDECRILQKAGFRYDGSWNWVWSDDRKGPIFRFPWPEESPEGKTPERIVSDINERNMFFGKNFRVSADFYEDVEHNGYRGGQVCMTQTGETATLLCCPYEKDAPVRFSSSIDRFVRVAGERRNKSGIYTVFACPHCESMFASEQETISKIEFPDDVCQLVKPFIETKALAS